MPASCNGNTNEAVNKVADAARNVADKAVNTVTDAVRDVADKAARTARTVTDEVGRIGEQTADAGVDVLHRGTETARDTVQAGLNTATQMFQGNTNEAANKATGAGRDAGNEAANEAARVGEQAARTGADVARRSAETARETLQSGLNTATETFQRITDQFTQVLGFNGPQAEELARRSSQNLQAVSQASTVIVKGAQDVSREWFNAAQERLTKGMDGLNRLAGCRSVQDFVAVQSDLARDDLQQIIATNQRIAELSVRVAEEAAQIIQAQANSNANQARRAA